MSVSKKCFKTVWPKEPVPPVIRRVVLVNGRISILIILYFPFNIKFDI